MPAVTESSIPNGTFDCSRMTNWRNIGAAYSGSRRLWLDAARSVVHFGMEARVFGLTWPRRYSLTVYLVHKPMLVLVLWAIVRRES